MAAPPPDSRAAPRRAAPRPVPAPGPRPLALPPRLSRDAAPPAPVPPLAATGEEAEETPGFPHAAVRAVLEAGFRAVLERHLEPPDPDLLGLRGLRGLGRLDPDLVAGLGEGALRVADAGRPLAAWPAPGAAERPGAWLAEAVTALLEAGWEASPRVRAAGGVGLLAAVFGEVFAGLDPYSRYVPAAEARAARARRVGPTGLGLRLAAGGARSGPGGVPVAAVAPGGAAAAAGVRAGDRLLAVDAVPVSTRGQAAALLEGPEGPPEGPPVRLRLGRGGRDWSVLVARGAAGPDPVAAERLGGVLWLRVTGFTAASGARLAEALADGFAAAPPSGVVLDLRGNRGGLLAQGVAVADAFLETGEVARTEGRHPDSRRVLASGGADLAAGRPLVVLVDQRTASTAEVVAAALADRGRAVVVGSATQGKGLAQVVVPLPDGADLLVTWARLLAPLGWPIEALGVLPAVCTSLGPATTAAEFARLRAGVAPTARLQARHRAARAPVPGPEAEALRAACPPADSQPGTQGPDAAAALALLADPLAWEAALPPP